MLKYILLAVAAAIAGLLLYASTRPDSFRVERTLDIAAPADRIYPLLEDFHRWTAWSPYEKLDADLQRSYSGAERGTGAVYAWEGRKAGAGRMQIVEAAPDSRLRIQLDFVKPMKTRNTTEFTLVPQDGGTRVTWSMQGPMPFVSKLVSLFFDMDHMLGKDFEAGLAALQTAARGA